MNQVFEETELAGIRIKNRIIRSATFERMGDERGCPTDKLSRLYVRLAEGGVGAIITGGTIVQQNGRPLPGSVMIDSDDFLDAFREMISPVKALGTPIIAQLEHAGVQKQLGPRKNILQGIATPLYEEMVSSSQLQHPNGPRNKETCQDTRYCRRRH